jgi:hypothetical protein
MMTQGVISRREQLRAGAVTTADPERYCPPNRSAVATDSTERGGRVAVARKRG